MFNINVEIFMAKGMTKSQFMQALAEGSGLSKKDIASLWDVLTGLVLKEVKGPAGEVTLPGLGKLVKKHRNARTGRNPLTGESIQIPAKTVVKFRVAKAVKDAVL